ncbi:hypothetical protein ACIRPK_04525 [Kitasatospora sp. NPDC101801]|uniref:hypothetical protein n=1 Tax=Kitasatospora sp. NPDC101801 TaxID=3364103 RepID=UPI00382AAFDA
MISSMTDGASRPTAGALRLIESRSEIPESVSVGAYLGAVGEHCPFLDGSRSRGLTGWTVYRIASGANRYAVEAELFYAGVQAAERLRPLMGLRHGQLRCENLVLLGDVVDNSHQELLAWPHWGLKNLYSEVGVMFGKFAKGVVETDRFGRCIPSPPFTFLTVRASVRRLDPGFLRATPLLASSLAEADDDGRDVFREIPCEWEAVKAWASSLPQPQQH